MRLERHELRHRDGRRLFVYGELRGTLGGEPDGLGEPSPQAGEPQTHGPPATGPQAEGLTLHKRFDRLTGAWIAVSPARNIRPHLPRPEAATSPLGVQSEDLDPTAGEGERFTAQCPLCPGGPEVPFSYEAAVFENRFPSLVADPTPIRGRFASDPRVAPAQGRCEVVLYTERHSGSLATLTPTELARLIAVWRDRSSELWADERNRYVMAFENRGEAVGATISHPHGQVYAFDHVPPLIAARVELLARHRSATGRCLTCDLVDEDVRAPERTFLTGEDLIVGVPFAARWPYEVHVRARRHGAGRLADLDGGELVALSSALRAVVLRYDGLFRFELPYMMVALEAPVDSPDWHLAFEFLPPHRRERLTKIRASVETATGLFINDTLPESSAARLMAIEVEPRAEEAVPEVVSARG